MNRLFSLAEQELLGELLVRRRDVRGNNFLPTTIPETHISKILEAAVAAPSVGLSQPWEFVLIQDKKIKNEIYNNFLTENEIAKSKFSEEKKERYSKLKLEGILEAPLDIAVFYKPPIKPTVGNNSMPETGEYSVVCAIQNMWLMARALNIGLGWVSIVNPKVIKETLRVPKDIKLIAYLCLGYVKQFHETPELEILKWEKRRNMSSFIHYNCYLESENSQQ